MNLKIYAKQLNECGRTIIKFFVRLQRELFLCSIKFLLLTALIACGSLVSCTSEYEERLEEAKRLQERYLLVEESNMIAPKEALVMEMKAIEHELDYLARLSGNEYTFYKDLKEN